MGPQKNMENFLGRGGRNPPRSDSEPGRYTQDARLLASYSRPSIPSIIKKLFHNKLWKTFLAGVEGIEPSLADLEAAVLPLNYTPVFNKKTANK